LPITTGTRIGSYEIAALLGAGGMGEVFFSRYDRLLDSIRNEPRFGALMERCRAEWETCQ